MSYAKGKNFNVVFLPLRYSAGDTYSGSGLVITLNGALVVVDQFTPMYLFTPTLNFLKDLLFFRGKDIDHNIDNYQIDHIHW